VRFWADVARYYFHVRDADGCWQDEEGVEMPDLATARLAAVAGLRDILAGDVRSGHLNSACAIEIRDEGNALLLVVPFDEAIELSDRPGPTQEE
jgi:hypothetical protein